MYFKANRSGPAGGLRHALFLLFCGGAALGIVAPLACSSGSTAARDLPNTLRIGVAAPQGELANVGINGLVRNLTSEQLVSVTWEGRPAPKLASNWTMLEDGSIRLELNPKATFHDGSPVDSATIKDSLLKQLEIHQIGLITYGSVRGVETDGPNGLIVRLSRKEPFFVSELANFNLHHPAKNEIGFGPYRLVEQDAGKALTKLEAHAKYYRGPPSIRFVVFQGFEEQRTAWASLMRGEVDAVHEITPGSMDFAEADSSIKTYPFVRPYFIQLGFNMRHPVLSNRVVRQALSQAVDREEIIKAALNGRGEIADGPIWPYHWAYGQPERSYRYNLEAATLRLDGAGLAVKASSEQGRMPSRFRFTCLTVPDARYEKLAVVLQKQLSDIGVDMEIEVLPLRDLVGRLQKGEFDAFLLERSSGRSLNWTYSTFHSKYFFTGYDAADVVLDRLRAAESDAAVRAAVVELQRVFYEDPPAVFLVWPQIARAVSTRFLVPAERGRDVIGTLWQWRPNPDVR